MKAGAPSVMATQTEAKRDCLRAPQRNNEGGHRLADRLRTVLLDEMDPWDRHLGLVGPGAAEFARTPAENGARLSVDEELGNRALRVIAESSQNPTLRI